jgi:hypothetical protein
LILVLATLKQHATTLLRETLQSLLQKETLEMEQGWSTFYIHTPHHILWGCEIYSIEIIFHNPVGGRGRSGLCFA